jgi:lipopolysaccharide transport system ATP-binding protein
MAVVVRVENVSKAYQLGQINTGTLSNDLKRWYARKRGKEDPFLMVGEENDRTTKGNSDIVWSLKDITFDINEGDSLGIVGRNGAGKSTLLKLLSQITTPTQGRIKIKGKIASLLEVGTGFHPELSGRENIFLNGAILGMRKAEIKSKFDEIVDFAGVERYIDTPVKRYSSGMYVRLAFAVAAHLESEILIVDEVLAVGDTEFQKKCMGKMSQLGRDSGRTIIFVSHNMVAIKQLCNTCIYLQNGKIVGNSDTQSIISQYLTSNNPALETDGIIPPSLSLHGTGEARFKKLYPVDDNGKPCSEFYFGDSINVIIQLESYTNLENISMAIYLLNSYGERVCMATADQYYKPINLEAGLFEMKVSFKEVIMPGEYSFGLSVSHYYSGSDIDFIETFSNFKITKESPKKDLIYPWATVHGYFKPKAFWEMKKIK